MTPTTTSTNAMAGVEEWEVPLVLIHEIPKMKYHASPLQFMSEPGISQAQYEQMVLSGA